MNVREGERGSDRRGPGGFDWRILACHHGCPRGAKDGVDRHPRSEQRARLVSHFFYPVLLEAHIW